MMPELKPEQIKLPGGCYWIAVHPDSKYGKIWSAQKEYLGIDCWKEQAQAFAAAMTRPDGGDSLREALERIVVYMKQGAFAAALTEAETALAAKDGE